MSHLSNDEILEQAVLKELGKEYVLIKRNEISERTRQGMLKAKKAGKQIGRLPSFTSSQIKDILALIDQGLSYREIAKKYEVSATTINKIKKGLITSKPEPLTVKEPEYSEQTISEYTARLKQELEHRNIILDKTECGKIIENILRLNINVNTEYNFYEYSPQNSYVELTLHGLYKKKEK